MSVDEFWQKFLDKPVVVCYDTMSGKPYMLKAIFVGVDGNFLLLKTVENPSHQYVIQIFRLISIGEVEKWKQYVLGAAEN